MNATRFALFYFSGRADAKAVLHKFGDGTPGNKSTMPRESVPYKTERVLFIHVISICAHRGDRLGIGSICARSKIAALPPIACIAPRSDSTGGSAPPFRRESDGWVASEFALQLVHESLAAFSAPAGPDSSALWHDADPVHVS